MCIHEGYWSVVLFIFYFLFFVPSLSGFGIGVILSFKMIIFSLFYFN